MVGIIDYPKQDRLKVPPEPQFWKMAKYLGWKLLLHRKKSKYEYLEYTHSYEKAYTGLGMREIDHGWARSRFLTSVICGACAKYRGKTEIASSWKIRQKNLLLLRNPLRWLLFVKSLRVSFSLFDHVSFLELNLKEEEKEFWHQNNFPSFLNKKKQQFNTWNSWSKKIIGNLAKYSFANIRIYYIFIPWWWNISRHWLLVRVPEQCRYLKKCIQIFFRCRRKCPDILFKCHFRE